MTKEKLAIKLAIDIMERNVNKYINHGIYEVSDTDGAVHVEFGEAINILNGMLEQELCEDCISRAQAIEAIKEDSEKYSGFMEMENYIPEDAISVIQDLPPVTPIRPKGVWEYDKTIQNWRCSKCHETPKTLGYVGTKEFMTEHFKFCNHCGADMRGKKDVT